MRYLVVSHDDGSEAAVPVNDSSVLNLKTFAPPAWAETGPAGFPILTEDQSFSLQGVVGVSLRDDAPPEAEVLVSAPALEALTDAQAAQLQAESVIGVAPMPWEA